MRSTFFHGCKYTHAIKAAWNYNGELSPINGYRFDPGTAKAPQLLGSVQCNDSTRRRGFQSARLDGAKDTWNRNTALQLCDGF